MRISDWSSDVCSSDLQAFLPLPPRWRHCRRLPEPVLRSTAVPAWQAHRCQHGRHVFRTFISPEKASGSTRLKPRSVSPHVKGILAPYRRNVRRGQDAGLCRNDIRHGMDDMHRSEEHTSELQSLMRNSYDV